MPRTAFAFAPAVDALPRRLAPAPIGPQPPADVATTPVGQPPEPAVPQPPVYTGPMAADLVGVVVDPAALDWEGGTSVSGSW